MRVDRRSRRRKSQTKGYLLSAAALLLLVGVFAAGALSFAGKAGQKGEESLRRAVTRASVQCYAIEGRYPPSLEPSLVSQGVARLVEGMEVDEAIRRLDGIQCGPRPTSCPDQLARALKQFKGI